MGKRGPLPANREQKWLRGAINGPHPRREKKQTATAPRMPAGLSGDEQAAWRRLMPKIAVLRILTEVDQLALVDLVRSVVRLGEAERDISERGLLVPGDRGKVKNRAVQLARGHREALARWSQRFGPTPGDSDRIEIPEPEKEPDEFDVWFSSRPSISERDPRELLRFVNNAN